MTPKEPYTDEVATTSTTSPSVADKHVEQQPSAGEADLLQGEDAKNMSKIFEEGITSAKTGWKSVTPFRQILFLYKLFFSKQFLSHRLIGLFFLLQYAYSFYLYFTNYNGFKASWVYWCLPATGVFQSVNAIYTFTFLPKNQKDGGESLFVFINTLEGRIKRPMAVSRVKGMR
ncbi:hypothetical protein HDU76_004653 [Blyttiomyces sp. JEL0837]|nr:hypothetical protein HDU76_004653 [Blyttiomyces sp. JEL0837]